MNTTLARTVNGKESDYLDLDINDLVKSASKVIVPLGPINTFAARNPWVGMEQQSFEQVARRLKDTSDVDIYPNDSIVTVCTESWRDQSDFIEIGLQNWLDLQSLEILVRLQSGSVGLLLC